MPSHSEGPGIWLSVWRFLLIHCLYERAAKVLARLRGCSGSPEPSLLTYNNWASSWQNLLLLYANNKGADQPAHPRSLISAFVVRYLDIIMPLLAIAAISRLQLLSVAVRLVWVLPGRKPRKEVFSWRGSICENFPKSAICDTVIYDRGIWKIFISAATWQN